MCPCNFRMQTSHNGLTQTNMATASQDNIILWYHHHIRPPLQPAHTYAVIHNVYKCVYTVDTTVLLYWDSPWEKAGITLEVK